MTLYYAIIRETDEHVQVFSRLKKYPDMPREVVTDLGVFCASDLKRISREKFYDLEDQAELAEFIGG